MEFALSIDCGTQSLRALLFDEFGNLHDMVKIPYTPYYSPNPEWAEQDANIYWQSLCKAVNTLKERNKEKFKKIIGVSITTQRDTAVLVDKNGVPLRPAII